MTYLRGLFTTTALVHLFQVSTRADSTRVKPTPDSGSVDTTSSGTTVETDVTRNKRGILKAQRPDDQLADFVDDTP